MSCETWFFFAQGIMRYLLNPFVRSLENMSFNHFKKFCLDAFAMFVNTQFIYLVKKNDGPVWKMPSLSGGV